MAFPGGTLVTLHCVCDCRCLTLGTTLTDRFFARKTVDRLFVSESAPDAWHGYKTNLPIWPQEHQPVSDMGDKDRCDPAKLLEECKAGVAELEFHPRP